jgi:hypothetical protein
MNHAGNQNKHDMACEENAHCAKSIRSCEEKFRKGISDLASFVDDCRRTAAAVDGATTEYSKHANTWTVVDESAAVVDGAVMIC